jgi:CHAT domain-containing protein
VRARVGFFVRTQDTLAFVTRGDNSNPVILRLGVGRAELAEIAAELQAVFSWERMNPSRPWRTTDMGFLEPLRERAVGPLLAALDGASHLVVSPHGPLYELPLHLLPADDGSLADVVGVSYVPSLDAYDLILKADGRRTEDEVVAFGLPAREDSPTAVQSVERTARALEDRSTRPPVLGPEVTVERVVGALAEADVVLLCCHGRFDAADPLRSGLLLAANGELPSRLAPTDAMMLTLRKIMAAPIRARLVILAACVTGRQALAAGGDGVGLVPALLAGGANAVLATNWSLDSRPGSVFVEALMRAWTQGPLTLGEAAHRAYRVCHSEFNHPFHWAAFSLHGDDGLRHHDEGAGNGK